VDTANGATVLQGLFMVDDGSKMGLLVVGDGTLKGYDGDRHVVALIGKWWGGARSRGQAR
jgi:hypothetical protein